MILATKLKNSAGTWSILKKYRVTDTATDGVDQYVNISGINSVLSNTANWFKISSSGSSSAITIDKTAGNITGSGTDFKIDLSADGLPAYPRSLMVYVDIAGDGNPKLLQPVIYNPITKVLSGMSDPGIYTSQTVKIIAE